jgi:pyridoxine/pyridoxamine 5'-phosphate oxidase
MAKTSIADLRRDYALHSLHEAEVAKDPFDQFGIWWEQATRADIDEVNAMTLSSLNGNTPELCFSKDLTKTVLYFLPTTKVQRDSS